MIWRIRCIFAFQALAFGAWLPRIPEVKDALGLSPSVLALVLLGLPTGILLTLGVAGKIVGYFGPSVALIWLFPPYLLVLALPPFAPSALLLFAALAALGVFMSLVELAQNLVADQIEKGTGRMIMSSCHGFWSLGTMSGSILGAGLAGWAISPQLSSAGLTLASLPLSVGLIWGLHHKLRLLPRPAAPPHAAGPRFALPAVEVIKIGVFVFGIALCEGAMMDWAALYLRDTFALGAGLAGLGLTVFSGFMTLGRLRGDALRARLGGSLAAQVCGGTALIALLLLVLSPHPATAYLALVFLGLGASIGFPLAVSSASQIAGQKVETTVAFVTFMALLGFLIGPVMIGFVADGYGLRWGLASVALPLLISFSMTPALGGTQNQTKPAT